MMCMMSYVIFVFDVTHLHVRHLFMSFYLCNSLIKETLDNKRLQMKAKFFEFLMDVNYNEK